ncbi:hypothetical protein IQ229_08540 [Nostoc cf. edaphicum LEGE 07299]|uniref:Uncharacterized protein n=1 Tax=Nostoc cf. edaphicum LEGE 07299 TaxID=2777974 RepID=A0ABR9TX57_9NOSO|nr:hypothetical protein [Nostoc edaphicum]MBE9104989.1 hypothetical protein [Nostoc cf. edaphicum LEGE 07299]
MYFPNQQGIMEVRTPFWDWGIEINLTRTSATDAGIFFHIPAAFTFPDVLHFFGIESRVSCTSIDSH